MSEETRENSDSIDRRTTLKAMGVAGAGLAGTVSATGDTEAASGPTAVIDATPKPAKESQTITFDGSQSSGGITKYEWFYDSLNSEPTLSSPNQTGEQITEQFAAGPYVMKLRVTDSSGNTDTDKLPFEVYQNVSLNPKISISKGQNGHVTFDGTKSTSPFGDITDYKWSYDSTSGDPILDWTASTDSGCHEQYASGEYIVKLVVTDETGRQGSVTKTFQVP